MQTEHSFCGLFLAGSIILLLERAERGRMSHKRERSLIVPWVYDSVLWLLSILVDLFFREIHPRGAWRVPRKGPIIVVAAPHANQVDLVASV